MKKKCEKIRIKELRKKQTKNLSREGKLPVSFFQTFFQEIFMRPNIPYPTGLVAILVTKPPFENTF